MPNYSKDEIEAFNKKDLRINRTAILKSLIESGRNTADEVKENCELANKYVDFIYNGVKPTTVSSKAVAEVSWEEVAKGLNITIPNEINVKVLNVLTDKYKTKFKVGVNKATLLSHITKAHGKYPTNLNSVELILGLIKTELGEQK